eukprot:GHRR01011449.1.p1 GENE.GHRR01011449.1~~GHRR01011449.1.p1  ORF type:complete len:319 (+),score=84.89 GHRR01011449.1:395-1351(+)
MVLTQAISIGLVTLACTVGHFVWSWLSQLLVTKRFLRQSPIPGPPPSNWIIGHVSKILSDDAPLQLAEWTNTYGPIYKIQLNNSPAVVLTDPAAITSLIRWPSSPTYITKSPDIYGALELGTQPQLHNILTSTDNAYWKAVRQGTAPCFSVSNLKQVFPWVLHLCSKAVQKVHETAATPAANGTTARDHTAVIAAEVNVVDIAKRFTSDVMGHMLFAEDLKGMDMGKSMYIDLFSKLLEEVHQNIANPLRKFMIWSADAKQGKEALKTHDKLMGDKLEAMLANPPPDYTITGTPPQVYKSCSWGIIPLFEFLLRVEDT